MEDEESVQEEESGSSFGADLWLTMMDGYQGLSMSKM